MKVKSFEIHQKNYETDSTIVEKVSLEELSDIYFEDVILALSRGVRVEFVPVFDYDEEN